MAVVWSGWRLRFGLVCFVVIAGLKEGVLDGGFEGGWILSTRWTAKDN